MHWDYRKFGGQVHSRVETYYYIMFCYKLFKLHMYVLYM